MTFSIRENGKERINMRNKLLEAANLLYLYSGKGSPFIAGEARDISSRILILLANEAKIYESQNKE